jgi:hypothetical protein
VTPNVSSANEEICLSSRHVGATEGSRAGEGGRHNAFCPQLPRRAVGSAVSDTYFLTSKLGLGIFWQEHHFGSM